MKVKFKFAPGQKVSDALTGLEGIISANVLLLEGYKQHQVQPKSESKATMPDGWLIDDIQLQVLTDGLENEKIFEVDFKYNIGSIAKDTVLGLQGTITKAIYYLNGCIFYKIQPKMEADLKIPESLLVNEKLVELVETVKEPELEEEPPRGPSECIFHHNDI